MSTVIIAFIIVTFVLLICLFLISINTRQRRKAIHELVEQFHTKGKDNNLLIPKWEIVGKLVIGLEPDKKTLLTFQQKNGLYRSHLIDLSNVKSCLKEKVYNTSIQGKGTAERYVEHISLVFEFKDERPPLQIAFYELSNNHLLEMAELEQKAIDWEQQVREIIHPDDTFNPLGKRVNNSEQQKTFDHA